MNSLVIRFYGPQDYESYCQLKSNGLLTEEIVKTKDYEVMRGSWGMLGVFVLWHFSRNKGLMLQTNGPDADKEIRGKIQSGDLLLFWRDCEKGK